MKLNECAQYVRTWVYPIDLSFAALKTYLTVSHRTLSSTVILIVNQRDRLTRIFTSGYFHQILPSSPNGSTAIAAESQLSGAGRTKELPLPGATDTAESTSNSNYSAKFRPNLKSFGEKSTV